jgi:hypothetical protein
MPYMKEDKRIFGRALQAEWSDVRIPRTAAVDMPNEPRRTSIQNEAYEAGTALEYSFQSAAKHAN